MTSSTLNLSQTNVIHSNNDGQMVHQSPTNTQNWLGHGVTVAREALSSAAESVFLATQKVFYLLHTLANDAPAVTNFYRKMEQHVLRFIEQLRGIPGSLGKLTTGLKHAVCTFDFFVTIADIDYFVCQRFKEQRNADGKVTKAEDNGFIFGGRLAFLTANLGGNLLWLQEMGFLTLSKTAAALGEFQMFSFVPQAISAIPGLRELPTLQKAAQAIGEFRVFSFVKNFTCVSVVLRALDLGYTLFAIDAAQRLINHSNTTEAISAGLDLSSYLSELFLSALVFVGVSNLIALGAAGSTCLILAATSFLYRETHANEIKQIKQN